MGPWSNLLMLRSTPRQSNRRKCCRAFCLGTRSCGATYRYFDRLLIDQIGGDAIEYPSRKTELWSNLSILRLNPHPPNRRQSCRAFYLGRRGYGVTRRYFNRLLVGPMTCSKELRGLHSISRKRLALYTLKLWVLITYILTRYIM